MNLIIAFLFALVISLSSPLATYAQVGNSSAGLSGLGTNSSSLLGIFQQFQGLSPLVSFPLGSILIAGGGVGSITGGAGSGGGSGMTKPFGGQVVMIRPCNDGLLVTIKEPQKGAAEYMWQYANLPYLMHVPPHPGQYLLGRSLTIVEPCIIGIVSIGAGFPIMFHGSGE